MGGVTLPTVSADLHAVTVHFFSRENNDSKKGVILLEYKGINYLRKKLALTDSRVNLRYRQYAMKFNDEQFGITIPKELRYQYRSVLGWCTKAVDSLADRLVFREF